MDKEDIRDAITLFQYSRTGQMGRGPDVLKMLWDLFKRNEIGVEKFGKKTLHGRWLKDRDGYDLRVNLEYLIHLAPRERFAALSLELVHEGTHATVDFHKLYDEMAARTLPIYYYRELSGPGVFNEADDPPVASKQYGVIRISRVVFPEMEEQSHALQKDQLIDWLLAHGSYSDSDYIDDQWVLENLSNWGGLANRLPDTKSTYIDQLDTSYDPRAPGTILNILESIKTRAEWTQVWDGIVSHRALRHTLQQARVQRAIFARITALETRWKVRLIEHVKLPEDR
jgi:hypothetical protein